MTAPKAKLHLTPEIYAAFLDYYRRNPAWGVLHVSMDDGNWKLPMAWALKPDSTDEERELVRLHDMMTPSQRRRLAAAPDRILAAERAGFMSKIESVTTITGSVMPDGTQEVLTTFHMKPVSVLIVDAVIAPKDTP